METWWSIGILIDTHGDDRDLSQTKQLLAMFIDRFVDNVEWTWDIYRQHNKCVLSSSRKMMA